MFTKKFMGGGNFHGRKLTPENCPQEICLPSPKEKKEKKRKLTPEKIIAQIKCKRKRRDDKKID